MITTEQIRDLREKTGVSVMQCKKALEEAKGDMERALILLRKKGADIAAKKAERSLGAGVIASYIHSTGTVGAMVELSSETDFVSKNEAFRALAYDIAMHVTASNPEFLKKEDVTEGALKEAREAFGKEVEGKPANIKEKIMEGKLAAYFGERTLLEQKFIKDQDRTVNDLIQAAIQKFGEKIEVSRFVRF